MAILLSCMICTTCCSVSRVSPLTREPDSSSGLWLALFVIIIIIIITIIITIINNTRPKPAYGRQGLDWIVGPGYSFVVFSTNKTMETNQKP